MGSDHEIAKLQDFIALPEVYARYKFAHECLQIPGVVFNGAEDPQNIQARSQLQWQREGHEVRKVLDIGIGKARLLAAIDELDRQDNIKTSDWLNYIGYDINDANSMQVVSVFGSVYGEEDTTRFYVDYDHLFATNERTIDIALMCNVFHELEPQSWLKYLAAKNGLKAILKPGGHLIIIEDQQIPVGEKANRFGFLLMGETQLRIVFGVSEADKDFYVKDYRDDGRLIAYRIPLKYLENVTEATIDNALVSLRDESLQNIREVRKIRIPDYRTARLHALWTQLFANSQLAIEGWKEVGEE